MHNIGVQWKITWCHRIQKMTVKSGYSAAHSYRTPRILPSVSLAGAAAALAAPLPAVCSAFAAPCFSFLTT